MSKTVRQYSEYLSRTSKWLLLSLVLVLVADLAFIAVSWPLNALESGLLLFEAVVIVAWIVKILLGASERRTQDLLPEE